MTDGTYTISQLSVIISVRWLMVPTQYHNYQWSFLSDDWWYLHNITIISDHFYQMTHHGTYTISKLSVIISIRWLMVPTQYHNYQWLFLSDDSSWYLHNIKIISDHFYQMTDGTYTISQLSVIISIRWLIMVPDPQVATTGLRRSIDSWLNILRSSSLFLNVCSSRFIRLGNGMLTEPGMWPGLISVHTKNKKQQTFWVLLSQSRH